MSWPVFSRCSFASMKWLHPINAPPAIGLGCAALRTFPVFILLDNFCASLPHSINTAFGFCKHISSISFITNGAQYPLCLGVSFSSGKNVKQVFTKNTPCSAQYVRSAVFGILKSSYSVSNSLKIVLADAGTVCLQEKDSP